MTEPLSWLEKLPRAQQEQAASDLRHIGVEIARKVQARVVEQLELLGEVENADRMDKLAGLIADLRAEVDGQDPWLARLVRESAERAYKRSIGSVGNDELAVIAAKHTP